MDLGYYVHVIRQHMWLVLLGPLVAGVVAFFVSEALPKVYQAETTILINQTQTPGMIKYNDILASQRLTNTYAHLVEQRPILSQVIDELDLPYSEKKFKSNTEVIPIRDTQLIKVKVKDRDPVLAARIANAITGTFIQSSESNLGSPSTLSITEAAAVPASPTGP